MARSLRSLGDYENLASVTAPKCEPFLVACTAGNGSTYKRQDQLTLSVPLHFDESSFNLSYANSLHYAGNSYEIGTLSYSRSLFWDRSSISLNVYNDFEHKNSYGAYAALTYSWDKSTASAIAEAATAILTRAEVLSRVPSTREG